MKFNTGPDCHELSEETMCFLPLELQEIIQKAFENEGVNDIPLETWSEEDSRKFFTDKIKHIRDLDADRMHFMRSVYCQMPWYYRFLSIQTRASLVYREASALLDKFCDEWIHKHVAIDIAGVCQMNEESRRQNEHNQVRRNEIVREETDKYYKRNPMEESLDTVLSFDDEYSYMDFKEALLNIGNSKLACPIIKPRPVMDEI